VTAVRVRGRFWHTGSVRVYLGSDHAGFELKATLVAWLTEAGHEPVDCGPHSYDPQDDYPVYVLRRPRGSRTTRAASAS
jgi:Ribose/Galactose Isomerase